MSSTKEAIQSAVCSLRLSDAEFLSLDVEEERSVLEQISDHFVSVPECTWWWECFSRPSESRQFDDGMGFTRLHAIVPDPNAVAWLVVEADSSPDFAVYSTSAVFAQRVIAECHAFEYYLVAKDLSWLVCENHHNIVIALGEARTRLVDVAG